VSGGPFVCPAFLHEKKESPRYVQSVDAIRILRGFCPRPFKRRFMFPTDARSLLLSGTRASQRSPARNVCGLKRRPRRDLGQPPLIAFAASKTTNFADDCFINRSVRTPFVFPPAKKLATRFARPAIYLFPSESHTSWVPLRMTVPQIAKRLVHSNRNLSRLCSFGIRSRAAWDRSPPIAKQQARLARADITQQALRRFHKC